MADIIVVLILCVVLFFAIRYIVKAKKNGACIGCPNSSQCSGGCNCNKSKVYRQNVYACGILFTCYSGYGYGA